MPTTHDLKVWPPHYSAIAAGQQNFDLREDDRGYMPGDTLNLQEYNPKSGKYTGAAVRRRVTYVLRNAHNFGLRPGYVILALTNIDASQDTTN